MLTIDPKSLELVILVGIWVVVTVPLELVVTEMDSMLMVELVVVVGIWVASVVAVPPELVVIEADTKPLLSVVVPPEVARLVVD